MKKEYMITYSIHDEKMRNPLRISEASRFELLMEAGFEWVRKKHYKSVKYYKIISFDEAKEIERKIRLIADEIIWGKDDGLEILNLNVKHEKNNLRFTNEERIIIKGDIEPEEDIIKWMEFMFFLKQVEDGYFRFKK
jgi:hypothetical protein